MKPRIGITIGDQSGIGREIIEKAIPLFSDVEFKIIGKIIPKELITYGQISSVCGRIAGEAIKEAIDLALCNKIDAVVTAPIHKEAFNLGGWKYAGHTEMFADLTHTKDYAMMLIYKNLRVVHVTTHVSLHKALDLITQDRIVKTTILADEMCRSLIKNKPRIIICGLNPHASDGGLFGDEEEKIIQSAIDYLQCLAFSVGDKPVPADIAFAKALGGGADAVIAMYHDQGHIPIKTLGYQWNEKGNEWGIVDGVNITLGLPFIRTSPDHGVAFGKAGKGIADPTSMISAIKLAVQLVNNKKGVKNSG